MATMLEQVLYVTEPYNVTRMVSPIVTRASDLGQQLYYISGNYYLENLVGTVGKTPNAEAAADVVTIIKKAGYAFWG